MGILKRGMVKSGMVGEKRVGNENNGPIRHFVNDFNKRMKLECAKMLTRITVLREGQGK